MRKAVLFAALVAMLGLIVDARPLSAQSVQAQPPFGAPPGPFEPPFGVAPAPMTPPPPQVRARTTRVRTARVRKARTAAERPHSAEHKRRHVAHQPPPNQLETAKRDGYKPLSDLVNFPKFFPGLGIVFVKPDTLPLGPFLCFDRDDHLIATVYMVSIKDIDDHKAFEAPGFAGKVDHISYYFNAGHPGMNMPHYHLVIWHVSKQEEARAAH
jgi:hypothetical protein